MASQDWFDKDFYKVLGVAKDVSESDLKKTYRKLARQYHPDSNAGDAKAEARFKEISEAYSVLSDPEQRTEYDQVRAMGSGARFTSGAGGAPGGFEDVFGSMFGGGNRRAGAGTAYGQNGFEDLLTRPQREHHARLSHRDQWRHHQPAALRRQGHQGQDSGGSQRRAEDPAQGQRRSES
jgi:DnaJ-class molecular chaperone